MEIKLIENLSEWDGWILRQNPSSFFTQSWQWGEVLRSEGERVDRLAITENSTTIACAQLIFKPLPFGLTYAFCPKGPAVVNDELRMTNDEWLRVLVDYLKGKNCVFLRLEPTRKLQVTSYKLQVTRDINPSSTLILDLTRPPEAIAAGFDKDTRYCLRQAEKSGLEISPAKDLNVLMALLSATGRRAGFNLHPEKHYRAVLASESSYQLTAYSAGAPAATAVFYAFGDTFTYLYAASDKSFRAHYPAYLIQQKAIELARGLGYKRYDFFGVAPSLLGDGGRGTGDIDNLGGHSAGTDKGVEAKDYEYDQTHAYAGFTQFKLGFGGRVEAAPGTFDLALRIVWYWLYRAARLWRG